MTVKEWTELEIDYIKFKLTEIALTCDNPMYKKDNIKRLKEIKIKLSSLEMVIS